MEKSVGIFVESGVPIPFAMIKIAGQLTTILGFLRINVFILKT